MPDWLRLAIKNGWTYMACQQQVLRQTWDREQEASDPTGKRNP
jgi:hypothetical protein